MKRFIAAALAVIAVISLSACKEQKQKSDVPETQKTFDVTTRDKVNIRIELEDGRRMEAELYPDIAPITVQNFVDLCTSGFYDGLLFHRIVKNFMIQAGGTAENTEYKSSKRIKGEFAENGVENNLKHTKGVLSMARQVVDSSTYDSASSQFFIVTAKSYPSLDGKYAAFGKLTSGYDVLAELDGVLTDKDNRNRPYFDVVIKYIRVID